MSLAEEDRAWVHAPSIKGNSSQRDDSSASVAIVTGAPASASHVATITGNGSPSTSGSTTRAILLLVSGATSYPRDGAVGHLVVPRSWNKPSALNLQPDKWAMDNGCFAGFDEGAYMRMLYAFRDEPACLFVVVPDVVADAAATLARWEFWAPIVRACGRRPAFVAQNGLTPERVPWGEFDALFIGGDDAYKDGPEARSLCAYAKALGVWVHWGRVNGSKRYRRALEAGADSIDGSGFSMYPDATIPKADAWREAIDATPKFWEAGS